jgi:hypothetical protein
VPKKFYEFGVRQPSCRFFILDRSGLKDEFGVRVMFTTKPFRINIYKIVRKH